MLVSVSIGGWGAGGLDQITLNLNLLSVMLDFKNMLD